MNVYLLELIGHEAQKVVAVFEDPAAAHDAKDLCTAWLREGAQVLYDASDAAMDAWEQSNPPPYPSMCYVLYHEARVISMETIPGKGG